MNPYASGRGWVLYHGDCREVLPRLAGVSMLLADPPYSSGGQFRGDRNAATSSKYQQSDAEKLPEFLGDTRDQRSWIAWASLWLADALQASEPGAMACVFTDWRQLPSLTDAIQAGGWVWRGVAPWDKINARPMPGRFRAQCEYIVWATNGPREIVFSEQCHPGLFTCAAPSSSEREHMTQKPVPLLAALIEVARPGGLVCDPFVGSGSTGEACIVSGRPFVGCELSEYWCEVAARRLARVEQETALFADVEKPPTQSQPPLFTDLSPPLDTGQ